VKQQHDNSEKLWYCVGGGGGGFLKKTKRYKWITKIKNVQIKVTKRYIIREKA
jgi:hypothetical protein